MQWRKKALAGLLVSLVCGAALATTRPIGPELAPVADGLNVNDFIFDCTPFGCTTTGYSPRDDADEGKLRLMCDPSHLSYNDPIVFPGRAGATHLHHFFGNSLTDHNSTYQSLRSTGEGSCQGGKMNRSGYWFPAMIKTDTNKVVVPDWIELYYNVSRGQLWDESSSGGYISVDCVSKGGSGLLLDGRTAACPMYAPGPLERGLKAIFGAYAATGTFPTGYVRDGNASGRNFEWSCTASGSGKAVLWDAATPSNGVEGCPAGTTVQVRMDAPSCWNGAYDSDDHYTHFAFATGDSNGVGICPSSHPYRIPALAVIIAWSHNGEADYKTWKLSSDIFNGANFRTGETFHTDAFWAWNDTVQETFHINVNGMHPTPGVTPYTDNASGINGVGANHIKSASDGYLGNLTALIQNGVDLSALPPASRYIDIPANSAKKGGRGKGGMR